jgi:hypothetical protein
LGCQAIERLDLGECLERLDFDGPFCTIKDAAPDPAAAPTSIVVVQNWFEELKRQVPSNDSFWQRLRRLL